MSLLYPDLTAQTFRAHDELLLNTCQGVRG